MSAHSDETRRQAVERHKRLLEHHLEKEPLRTGEQYGDVAAREKVALAGDTWTVRRRAAGWLYVVLVLLILLMGGLVLWLFSGVWRAAHELPDAASERVLPTGAGERAA